MLTSRHMAGMSDEFQKIAGIPKGLNAISDRAGDAGEYAYRRLAAHQFGRAATRPKKWEYVATGGRLGAIEARVPKSPNPSPGQISESISQGKEWRDMARAQLTALSHKK